MTLPACEAAPEVETTMKLAFSTNAYLRFGLQEALERVAALGYEGVELTADVPHLWPAGLLESQKEAARRSLQRLGLGVSNVNAFMMNALSDARQPYWYPSWIEPYAPYRQVRIDHTKRALTLARELGAPSISTEPGGPVPEGTSFAEALKLFVEVLKPVVEHAERVGVCLLVEPEPGLLIETSDQYLEFAEQLQSPMLGLNCDVGHFFCVGEDPATVIKKLAGHLRHVHVEDIAANRVHQHLIPGHGAIDFQAVIQALRAIGYRGWVTVELYPYVQEPDAAAREAYQVLAPLVYGT
jgi:sugar phosphate isomerase/epimerase